MTTAAALGRALALALATEWEPGNPTTAEVSPEVEGSEDFLDGDGIYGRFAGNLELSALAGAEVGAEAVGGTVGAAAHYYSTAGVFARYTDFFGGGDARWERLMVVGVDVRPLFIPRMAEGLQTGPGILDLTLDSTAIGLGAFWAAPPGGSFGDRRGLEVSLGLAVPILGEASGPQLGARGLLRFHDPGTDGGKAQGTLLVSISWHGFATAPL